MQKEQLNQLIRRLERAEQNDLYGTSNALIKDIELLAREDLYRALRIWDTYASKDVKENNLRPVILNVAAVVEKHYEGKSEQIQPDISIRGLNDAVVSRPKSNEEYEGKIVAQTPVYVVQKCGDDYVLHKRESLTVDPKAIGDEVKIRYPFKAIGGVGIVTQIENQLSRELSEIQAHKTHALKPSEKELDL